MKNLRGEDQRVGIQKQQPPIDRASGDLKTMRPDIFGYHDYRTFLKDWLSFLKESQSGCSLRQLVKKSKIALGTISTVLSGTRELSKKAFEKLTPHLRLQDGEKKYFECLVQLGSAATQKARIAALEKMNKFKRYRENNPREIETVRYLTPWYYFVIREMSGLPDFQLNSTWIQNRLVQPVLISEIEKSLKFLIAHKYIEADENGIVQGPSQEINCSGDIYQVALFNGFVVTRDLFFRFRFFRKPFLVSGDTMVINLFQIISVLAQAANVE